MLILIVSPLRLFAQAELDTTKTVIVAENQEAEMAFNRGFDLFKNKKFNEAIAEFDVAIQIKPGFYQAYTNRGNAKLELHEFSEAIEDYTKAIGLKSPNIGSIYYNRGYTLYMKGDYEKAITDLENAAKNKFINQKVYYYTGVCYYNLKKYQPSIAAYDKALQLNPQYAYALNDRGSAKRQVGDLEGAVSDYLEAIRVEQNAIFYNNLGSAYRKMKIYDEAIDAYETSVSLKPDYHIAYNNMGSTKYEIADYKGAIEAYNKAISIKADYASAYNNLGTVLYVIEDYKGSLEALNKAISLDPNYAFAYFNRANAKEMLKDTKGALDDWKKAKDLGASFADNIIKEYNK